MEDEINPTVRSDPSAVSPSISTPSTTTHSSVVYTKNQILSARDEARSLVTVTLNQEILNRRFSLKAVYTYHKHHYNKQKHWKQNRRDSTHAEQEEEKIVRPQPRPEELQIKEEAKQNSERIQAERDEDEILRREIKVSLNKLSAGNLTKLKDKLFALAKYNPQGGKLLFEGIFNKACLETKYTELYADLSKHLEAMYTAEGLVETTSSNHTVSHFRKHILDCSRILLDSFSDQGPLQPEKLRGMGNIRFIGALHRNGLINHHVLLFCLRDLISPTLKAATQFRIEDLSLSEDRLEGFCLLVPTLFRTVEAHPSMAMNYLTPLVNLVSKIRADRIDLSPRIKVLLLNVIEEANQLSGNLELKKNASV